MRIMGGYHALERWANFSVPAVELKSATFPDSVHEDILSATHLERLQTVKPQTVFNGKTFTIYRSRSKKVLNLAAT